jgi:hypothetical protein
MNMDSLRRNHLRKALMVAGIAFSTIAIQAQTIIERKYTVGEIYRYQLITEEYHNGKWKSTTTVINELEVVKDSLGIPHDKVRWISREVKSSNDTIRSDAEAMAIMPYLISLHPKGKLEIPKIDVQGMTGAIQDFATFFVAVSPHIGATALQYTGETFIRKELVTGNFANGMNILKGDDCFVVAMQLDELTEDQVRLTTSFQPPLKNGLSYLLKEMEVPVVKDTLNNFQMVLALGNGRYNVQYGKEAFVITTSIARKDGKIKQAEMYNQLNLKLKINCDAAYNDCKMEVPFLITRKLKLKLLE